MERWKHQRVGGGSKAWRREGVTVSELNYSRMDKQILSSTELSAKNTDLLNSRNREKEWGNSAAYK